MSDATVNLWVESDHVQDYLDRRSEFPWRELAYDHLVEHVPPTVGRVLDLGCGDGKAVGRVVEAFPAVEAIACDFSPAMLERARAKFAGSSTVTVVEHDLDDSLPDEWGTFDAIVSAFAIHHVVDDRKRALYGEVLDRLAPGGVFCNLEHVASPTPELHEAFLRSIGQTIEQDDPSNKLAPVETQLAWLRDLGFTQVDCHYKWREIALLAGVKPAS
ncbi:MAG TPA: class I SAM-dependent methyltransferase [Acidimicrobiia bacterium]|nr:class I SAM-dependent methyltransferase [Acidimicrobiia bacterium]